MKKILVVEDNEFNYYIIEALLASINIKTIHAANGKEAVSYFKKRNSVSLILMDIQMPVMDGFAATKEIRKIDDKIPIVVQTSYSFYQVKEKAFQSGCSDFIDKPLSADNLLPVVEKYIY